jgi:hypothetical protein
MAREQGKSILGSQLDHLRCQLREWPWEIAAAAMEAEAQRGLGKTMGR